MLNSSWLKIKRFASWIIVVATIFFIGRFVSRHIGDFKSLSSIHFGSILLIAGLFVLAVFTNGIILKLLVNKFGISISVGESFYMSVMTSFYNLMVPFQGGTGVRALYLKRKHNFDYTKFISTLWGNYLILYIVIMVLFLVVSLLLHLTGINNVLVEMFMVLLLGVLILLTLIRVKVNEHSSWLVKKMADVSTGWEYIKGDRKLLLYLFFLNVFFVLLGAFIFQATFISFGVHLSFLRILYLHLLSSMVLIINLTPASLGIYEGAIVLAAGNIGIVPSEALSFAIIFRPISFIVLFLLFGLGMLRFDVLANKH